MHSITSKRLTRLINLRPRQLSIKAKPAILAGVRALFENCLQRTARNQAPAHWLLSIAHLRTYLERLPDFEDLEAEERAISQALKSSSVHQALAFLVSWPALEKAATLVTKRTSELNGDHFEISSPVADTLAAKYPLAATLLLRAMIDFALKQGEPRAIVMPRATSQNARASHHWRLWCGRATRVL
jgi:hypothetical protein